MRRLGETLRIFRQHLDLLGQLLAGETLLPDHPRAARFRQFARIGGLVVVGRDRQRDEDCRATDRSQLGNGGCARAPDEQMRIGKAGGHVLEIGRQFGGNAMRAIAFADRVEILGAALLRHLQLLAQRRREHGKAVGHHFGQHPRALAAAGDEHPQQAVFGKGRERFVAQTEHACAYRIPDKVDLPGVFRVEPLDFGIGGGDGVHPSGEQAIDPAEHGVLLVYDGGHAGAGGSEDCGQRRVAAKADHRAGLETVEQPQRHAPPFPYRLEALEPAERVLAEPACRNDMRGQEIGLAGDFGTALVGDQRDMMTAPVELGREREGGQQMPAGAPGSEDEMAAGAGHG